MRTGPADGLLPRFDRRSFAGDETLTCLGSGRLGGKASGLAFVRDSILPRLDPGAFAGIDVVLPRLTVISTDMFDAFMERNSLWETALSGASDDRLAHAFQLAQLPTELLGDLRGLVEQVRTPLAVRSSSLLEDALAHPFAGVYATKMIPNNQPDPATRFRRLVEAIKLVYASTYFSSARSYGRAVGAGLEAEKMAVIIQEVVGRRHGDLFYPEVSGVARSYDHYAVEGCAPEHGRVSLALGLGKTIVDGDLCWSYSPARPTAPPPFGSCREMLANTQNRFWSVDMGPPPPYDPLREAEYLALRWVTDARRDGTLDLVGSTYDPQSDRLMPGVRSQGAPVIDFAPLLGLGVLPLNPCVSHLMEVARDAVEQEVEIEFALTRSGDPNVPSQLGFLQVRPMARSGVGVGVSLGELAAPGVVVASTNCLGDGRREGIEDVVFLKPDAFAAQHTPLMAQEVGAINHRLEEEGRHCLLIGFGRWGSSEPWLGVPVSWDQISAARVVVEATTEGMSPDMSQGSHFFHNLISLEVLYLSVPAGDTPDIDWDWLERQETVQETRFVKHVRTRAPVTIKVDGGSRRGVVRQGG